MKKNLKDRLVLFGFPGDALKSFTILMIILMLSGCTQDTAHEHDEYTCPMHPTVISDRPGSCPVCGMDLVLKGSSLQEQTISENLSDVLPSTNESVIASIKTIRGEFRSAQPSFEAQGIVTHDNRKVYTVSSRVSGRLESSNLKYAYQPVSKGQRIASIYSPEMITAQRELLFLLENDPSNTELIESSQKKLSLLGLTEHQIRSLVQSKQPGNTILVYSPYSGFLLVEEIATSSPPSTTNTTEAGSGNNNGMADGMASGSSGSSLSTPGVSVAAAPFPKEGDYVKAGQPLWRIVDHSSLRIEFDLPRQIATSIRKGDKIVMNLGNDKIKEGSVDLVQPFFNDDQDFLKVRVTVKDTHDLRVGQLVSAVIKSDSVEGMWIPREAVIDLGRERIVFVKEKGIFKPIPVTTGITSKGSIHILRGLTSTNDVAANAQYLIDSESNIVIQD